LEGNIKSFFLIMTSVGEQLQKITELIEAGIRKPALDSVLPVDRFQQAFEKLESGRPRGKIVLELVSS
jgi:NADPH:quinone reductase-like Zn-dependent oxidoreductase